MLVLMSKISKVLIKPKIPVDQTFWHFSKITSQHKQIDRTSQRIISFFVTDPMSEYSQKELLLDGILICYLSSNSHMDL